MKSYKYLLLVPIILLCSCSKTDQRDKEYLVMKHIEELETKVNRLETEYAKLQIEYSILQSECDSLRRQSDNKIPKVRNRNGRKSHTKPIKESQRRSPLEEKFGD